MCDKLKVRLEKVLLGEYDLGNPPDKVAKIKIDKDQNEFIWKRYNKTLQIINIWKADKLFKEVILSP